MGKIIEILTGLVDERKRTGLTQADVANEIGISAGALSQYLNGKREPELPEALKLGEYFKISVEALFGKNYRIDADPMASREGHEGWDDECPVIQPVSAGLAHSWEDAGHASPRIKKNCKDPHCYAVEVWGDSMETVYHQGDILVIAPTLWEPKPNDLVVFKTIDDEPYFKKFLGETKGILRFASFNPEYPVMEFKPKQLREQRPHVVHHVIRPLRGKIF